MITYLANSKTFSSSLYLPTNPFQPSPMDDTLANMWNTLSLTENELITVDIDPNSLSVPSFAILGKLAIKKHVGIYELDRGLKFIWNVENAMDTTAVGDNTYCFIFQNAKVVDRILENQPWNFRGSLIMLERVIGNEHPTDMVLHTVPFWVQIHGLQIRAMNRAVGEVIGALIEDVIDISCDDEGQAIGPCLRVRVRMDVFKTIIRWTNVNIGGNTCKVLFRYEKLADYCYVCGSLTHLEKHCPIAHPNGLCFYGHWLRANANNPVNMLDISNELNRINSRKASPAHLLASPKTPTTRELFSPSPSDVASVQNSAPKRIASPYPIDEMLQTTSNIAEKPAPTCSPGFENQKWNFNVPTTDNIQPSGSIIKGVGNAASINSKNGDRSLMNLKKHADVAAKDLFDADFLQNFSFSPNLTMSKLSDSLNCYSKAKSPVDQLIPTDLMLGFFQSQDTGKSAALQIREATPLLQRSPLLVLDEARARPRSLMELGVPPTIIPKRDTLLLRKLGLCRPRN